MLFFTNSYFTMLRLKKFLHTGKPAVLVSAQDCDWRG